jgi:polyisoprenoid-binding protein YceI
MAIVTEGWRSPPSNGGDSRYFHNPGASMTSSGELPIPGYTAGTWTIDTVHSHVGFVIKHMMVSKVRGRFTSFSGEITLTDDPFASSVSVSIEAMSIDTDNSTRDGHIRSADFFHADEYPTLTFTSTGVRQEEGEIYVDGDLTIRGTTRPVTLTLEPPEFGPGPDGGTKAGFSATTEINRTDFGVSYNGPIPGGGVALAEKVQIVLDIEADLSKE